MDAAGAGGGGGGDRDDEVFGAVDLVPFHLLTPPPIPHSFPFPHPSLPPLPSTPFLPQVQAHRGFTLATTCQAIDLFDRFLAAVPQPPRPMAKLFVALASLGVAIKMVEAIPILMSDLITYAGMADGAHVAAAHLARFEVALLSRLQWDVSENNAVTFLDAFTEALMAAPPSVGGGLRAGPPPAVGRAAARAAATEGVALGCALESFLVHIIGQN